METMTMQPAHHHQHNLYNSGSMHSPHLARQVQPLQPQTQHLYAQSPLLARQATSPLPLQHQQQQQLYGSGSFHVPLQPTPVLARQASQPLVSQSSLVSLSLPSTPQPQRHTPFNNNTAGYNTPQPQRLHQQPQPQQQQPLHFQQQPLPQQQRPQQQTMQQAMLQRHVSTQALMHHRHLQPQQVASMPASPMLPTASPSLSFNPFDDTPAMPASPSLSQQQLHYGSHQLPLQAHRQLQHQHSQPLLHQSLQHPLPFQYQQLQPQQSMPQMPMVHNPARRMSRSEPTTPVLMRHATAAAAAAAFELQQQQQQYQPASSGFASAAVAASPASRNRIEFMSSASGESVTSVLTPAGEMSPAGAADGQGLGPNDEFGPAVPRGAAVRAGQRLKRRVTRGLAATFSVLAQLDDNNDDQDGDDDDEDGESRGQRIKYVDGRADEETMAAISPAVAARFLHGSASYEESSEHDDDDESRDDQRGAAPMLERRHQLPTSTGEDDLLGALSRQSCDY